MKGILILVIIILVSCNNKKGNSHTDNMVNRTDTVINESPKKESVFNQDSQIYFIENDTIMQSLEIKNFTKKDISFIIVSKNKKEGNIKQLEGKALVSNNTDIEFEEDEEGNALPVTEYIYKKNDCWVSIKIDLEKKEFVKLKESDCDIFSKNYSLNTGLFLHLKVAN